MIPFFPPSLPAAVKVEKMHLKTENVYTKIAHAPTSSSSCSSYSTVSSSPSKPGLNSPSVPKPQLLSPGHIPNGKSHLSHADKKQDSGTNGSSKRVNRRQIGEGDLVTGVQISPPLVCCRRSLVAWQKLFYTLDREFCFMSTMDFNANYSIIFWINIWLIHDSWTIYFCFTSYFFSWLAEWISIMNQNIWRLHHNSFNTNN